MAMIGQVGLRKQIAGRLKQARNSAGYKTAEDFCEKNALELKIYLKHEDAKSVIRASHASLYSRLLGVSLFWLMLGDD